MHISFHNEDISFRLRQVKLTREWIQQISTKFNKEVEQLSFVFCTDEYLLDINRSYLDHDYYTDIITFPYQNDPIISDIFISLDRVKENAKKYNTTFEKELRRVMAHGVLHLCGLHDKTEEEKNLMRGEEETALSNWQMKLIKKKSTK